MSLHFPALEDLSLPQQIAQLVVVRTCGYLFDPQIRYPNWEANAVTLQRWVQELGVGGVIFLGGSAAELALKIHQIQEWATIPLLMAADVEEGAGQRFPGATWLAPPMALSAIAAHAPTRAIALAEQMGSVIAQESRAIGLNWVLAPVVDVNNNPDNPVINVRSFGSDADQVAQLAAAFIRGAHRHSVLTAAKHFPGHGDTAIDSHLELPVIEHSLDRLQTVEFPPFQAAIAAGVDAVMTAHLQVPVLDEQFPATLSEPTLNGILRQAWEFDGLIVTDAMVMGAIADRYGTNEAAVLAVMAGADVIMMPADPEGAIAAIAEAVEAGRISCDRIRASVQRIWRAKQTVCSLNVTGDSTHAWEAQTPTVEARSLMTHVATPEALDLSDAILQESMRIHLPVISRMGQAKWCENLRNLIITDEAIASELLGRHTPALSLPTQHHYQPMIVDRYTPPIDPSTVPWQPTLLQLFIRGNPFRGSAGLTETAWTWFEHLVKTEQIQALVIYGSPYVVDAFVHKLPMDVPYVFTYGQMPQAQAIALGKIFDLEHSTWGRSDFTD